MNFKKLAAALMAAALCVTGAGCSRSAESSGNTGDTGNTDGTVSDGGSAREFDTELTAMQLTSDIKIGWNLGNTLDATGGSGLTQETSWGNPAGTHTGSEGRGIQRDTRTHHVGAPDRRRWHDKRRLDEPRSADS